MTVPPWILVLAALPVLLFGEWLVRKIPVLGRFSIPAPVIGGLLVSLVVLLLNATGASAVQLVSKVSTPWWTWLVTIEPEWGARPERNLALPLLVGFFTCIGLNATWDIVRRGSVALLIFLGVATLLGVAQNLAGIAAAKAIGENPLLGIVCGSLTLAGGHATALGFAPQFEQGGLAGAAEAGAASATLGLVAGGLLSGVAGAWLIRRHGLKSEWAAEPSTAPGAAPAPGILHDLRLLLAMGGPALKHLLVVIACVKAGAWLSFYLQKTGVTFPVHIGAMIVGVILRNALDFAGLRWLRTDVIAALTSALLAAFLILAMMGLNLMELAHAALPMLCILAVVIVVTKLFAVTVCWRVMGRDYEAAVMATGLCGFGIGNTANAVASMKSLVERHGPAPRAFLVVPLVGAMLGDLTNALNITFFLNLVQ